MSPLALNIPWALDSTSNSVGVLEDSATSRVNAFKTDQHPGAGSIGEHRLDNSHAKKRL